MCTCLCRPSLCQRCLWEKLSNEKWRTEEADERRRSADRNRWKREPKYSWGDGGEHACSHLVSAS